MRVWDLGLEDMGAGTRVHGTRDAKTFQLGEVGRRELRT